MARYNGPKTKISRIFGEPILGNGKWLGKNSNPPGQHAREDFRKLSHVSGKSVGSIFGLGLKGYELAVEWFLSR